MPPKKAIGSLDDELLRKLLIVKQNEVRMMKARGYSMEQDTEHQLLGMPFDNADEFLEMDLEDLKSYQDDDGEPFFKTRIDFSTYYYTDPNDPKADTVWVLYPASLKGGPTKAEDLKVNIYPLLGSDKDKLGDLKKFPNQKIILISELGLSNEKKFVANAPAYQVSFFRFTELAFNRLEHAYNPSQIKVIPKAEIKSWMKQEGFTEYKNLPKVFSDDLVAKWMGAIPGDIIEYHSLGLEYESNIRYRYVIPRR